MTPAVRSVAITFGLVVAMVLDAPTARADRAAEIRACAEDSELGQLARKEGKLVGAHERLLACATATCPEQIRVDCERWAREVSESLPTMVVVVRDPAGADLPDAVITIDGREVPEATRGRAFSVDPGPHVVRASRSVGPAAEQSFVIHEGERLRSFRLVLPAPDAAPAAPPPLPGAAPPRPEPAPSLPEPAKEPSASAAPLGGWMLLGVGAVALGTASLFAIRQKLDYDELEATCAPRCDPAEAKAIDDARVVAAVTGGVGVAAAVAGAWLLLRDGRPQRSASRVGVTVGGASLQVLLRY